MIAFSRLGLARFLWCTGCTLALTVLLTGCHGDTDYDALAPSPTVNPNAHKYSHLKITVEPNSGVNQVEVYTTWVISNLGCAPRRWPSGSTIQKEVEVKEKVKKIDGYYLATIRDDYYLPGKCKWITNVALSNVKFMRNNMLLASGGGGVELFRESNPLKLVCIPPPHAPLCELRNRETFDRAHFEGVFNAALEIENDDQQKRYGVN